MNSLNSASSLLNSVAPPGERLAYINPQEELLLKQIGGSGAEHVAGIPSYNFLQDMIDGVRGKSKRKAAERQQQQQEAKQKDLTQQELIASQIATGQTPFTDLTDTKKVDSAIEGMEGEYVTPIPNYLPDTKDLLLGDLEDTSSALEGFIGSSEDRMADLLPSFEIAKDSQKNLIDSAASIFDPDGIEKTMRGFLADSEGITNELKDLNTRAADFSYGQIQDRLNRGELFADSARDAVLGEADFANQEFDALRNASDAQLAGEQALAAVARRNASLDAASGLRGLGRLGSGTNNRMASMMLNADRGMQQSEVLANALIDQAIRTGEIEADRFNKLGEINPAEAELLRNEALLKNLDKAIELGDPRLGAEAENLGLDQGIVESRAGLETDLLNTRLQNSGLLPSLLTQESLLPSIIAEAGINPTNPIANAASGYTQTASIPAGQTTFNNQPYVPQDDPSFLDLISNAPEIYKQGKNVYNEIKDILPG
jgi:hypothetical protein